MPLESDDYLSSDCIKRGFGLAAIMGVKLLLPMLITVVGTAWSIIVDYFVVIVLWLLLD